MTALVICEYLDFHKHAEAGTSGYDKVTPVAVTYSRLLAEQFIQKKKAEKPYQDFIVIEVPKI